MKKSNIFLTLVLVSLLSTTASAATVILGPSGTQNSATTSSSPIFTFTRSLSLGMTGQDVSALNNILDLEFNTTIANPSTFSAATQNYVISLQERYATDILIPNGLSAGTGYVGPSTIKKLDTLAQQYNLTVADFPAPVAPAAPSYPQIFTQTLSLGSVSSQVALLKTVLNSDPSTQILYTSASQQQSSSANVFDTSTQIAVNKFQQKYASVILIPNGLTSPTGIVGPSTRAKLNMLLATVSSGGTTTAVATTTYTVPVNTNVITNSCTTDLYSCSDWGPCSHAGTQTRTCQITYACQNPGANHVLNEPLSQSCTPIPYCPTYTGQSYTYTYNLNFNGGRQGGVRFNLSGFRNAYAPGETVTLSGNVGITDGGPFSIDQMNMAINGSNIVAAKDIGLYGSSNIVANSSGSQSFTAPTAPGNYIMSVSYYIADVYDGGLGTAQMPIGPKVLGQSDGVSQVVNTYSIPYTVLDPTVCDPSLTSVPASSNYATVEMTGTPMSRLLDILTAPADSIAHFFGL